MRTDNIFHLVYRFANLEDQISACFGFVLQSNRPVLVALLRRLHIPTTTLTGKDIRSIDVETQVSYGGREDERSRIDLQVRLPGRFIVFLESKLGNTGLGGNQLGKYATILRDERETYDHTRLVLVTQFDRRREAENWERALRSRAGLRRGEFYYLRWREVQRLVEETPANGRTRFLNHLFLNYVGDMMSDKKVIKDQVIGQVAEVMVATTDPDFWDLAVKKWVAVQANNSQDAHYVAFYRTHPVKAITHIAEVDWTEKNVPASEVFRGFPNLLKKAKKGGWFHTPQKVYRLKELIELSFPIRNRPGKRVPQVKMFKTMADLLRARYVDDLYRGRPVRR